MDLAAEFSRLIVTLACALMTGLAALFAAMTLATDPALKTRLWAALWACIGAFLMFATVTTTGGLFQP